MNNFKASVQYSDFKGSAAADRNDRKSITSYLTENGLMTEAEFVLYMNIFFGENNTTVKPPVINVYVLNKNGYDNVVRYIEEISGPIPLRKIRLEVEWEDFLILFKRMSISLVPKGLELENREFIEIE